MLYLPHFFSWVVIGGILIGILSPKYGVVNQILSGLGMEPIYFLGDKAWWVVTYVLSGIWKEAGWSAIIYYAALQSIDTTLYEAARIDGANRFKQLLYVTLPGIRTTIAIMLILKISALLTIGFEQPFILSNPLVLERADVISTFIFTMGIQQGQFSLTAAMGLFQSVIGLTLVLIANAFIKKMGEEGIF
jgi:putative aldouronate transport system permease protein